MSIRRRFQLRWLKGCAAVRFVALESLPIMLIRYQITKLVEKLWLDGPKPVQLIISGCL